MQKGQVCLSHEGWVASRVEGGDSWAMVVVGAAGGWLVESAAGGWLVEILDIFGIG